MCLRELNVYCKCVRVCVFICMSFYMSVTWNHVVDSYSLDLYDVMCVSFKTLSLTHSGHSRFAAVRRIFKHKEREREKKKRILKTFLSNVAHATCLVLVETRKHQMSKREDVSFLSVFESPGNTMSDPGSRQVPPGFRVGLKVLGSFPVRRVEN